jgi:hypothetical protein
MERESNSETDAADYLHLLQPRNACDLFLKRPQHWCSKGLFSQQRARLHQVQATLQALLLLLLALWQPRQVAWIF